MVNDDGDGTASNIFFKNLFAYVKYFSQVYITIKKQNKNSYVMYIYFSES